MCSLWNAPSDLGYDAQFNPEPSEDEEPELEELEAEVSQYFNIRKNKSVNLTHSLLLLNPLILFIIKTILKNDFEFSTTHHAICLTKFRCKPFVAAAVVHFMTAW